jgi:glycosyltransferase involved in cell wall biosynthesis
MNVVGWDLWERWLRDYLGIDELRSSIAPQYTATIAVCTRDRTEDLQRCLDSLMRLPNDGQEILVVDNCPSDDGTHQLVAGYPRVRYVRENRPGLNVARNRALREAKHDFVVFTDDDTMVDSGWLRCLLHNFEDPLVFCVTGLTMPLELETEAQEWSEHYCPFGRGFKRAVFDGTSFDPLASAQVGAGANMALRRDVLTHVGAFDEALDAGTPTRSGGDTEMFTRILAGGYSIVYEPTALSWHRHRRTWEELRKMIYGYGIGVYALWTRNLLIDKQWGVLKRAWYWFRDDQFPALRRSLFAGKQKHEDSITRELIILELRGCMAGPRAYLAARKLLRERNSSNA